MNKNGKSGDDDVAQAAKRSPVIRNTLILAGSIDERRLLAFGPQYQNETKKQTGILEKIAKNTEKTADEVSDISPEKFGDAE